MFLQCSNRRWSPLHRLDVGHRGSEIISGLPLGSGERSLLSAQRTPGASLTSFTWTRCSDSTNQVSHPDLCVTLFCSPRRRGDCRGGRWPPASSAARAAAGRPYKDPPRPAAVPAGHGVHRSFFGLATAQTTAFGNLRLTPSFVPVLKTRTFRLQTGTKPVHCSLIARSRGLD